MKGGIRVSRTPLPAPPLNEAYRLLLDRFGFQHWWPAETPFEVCVGAILVQNTSWTQVERVLAMARKGGWLTPGGLRSMDEASLREWLRPTGTYRVKAERLRAFLRVLWSEHAGSLDALLSGSRSEVRNRLLAIRGIGPETADCLVLYAAHQPSFVIDAYTRRVFWRHGWSGADAAYEQLQELCETALDGSDRVRLWQDFHAQMVAVGKEYCRSSEARCEDCPMKKLLPKKEAGGSNTVNPPHQAARSSSLLRLS